MRPISIPVVEFLIFDEGGRMAPFTLSIYGIDIKEFMVSPGGGSKVREALERRGFHNYQASPFAMRAAPAIQRTRSNVQARVVHEPERDYPSRDKTERGPNFRGDAGPRPAAPDLQHPAEDDDYKPRDPWRKVKRRKGEKLRKRGV